MRTSLRRFAFGSPLALLQVPALYRWWTGLFALSAVLCASLSPLLHAQSVVSAHALNLSKATESIDHTNRRIIVAHVAGDLPGVLTLALVVASDGSVTGGEWALNVSYIRFGPPDKDGDGDASEFLVQRGVIKGSVTGGLGRFAGDGLFSDLAGIQLNVTGATMEFAATRQGSGTVAGTSMNRQSASTGLLTLSF